MHAAVSVGDPVGLAPRCYVYGAAIVGVRIIRSHAVPPSRPPQPCSLRTSQRSCAPALTSFASVLMRDSAGASAARASASRHAGVALKDTMAMQRGEAASLPLPCTALPVVVVVVLLPPLPPWVRAPAAVCSVA